MRINYSNDIEDDAEDIDIPAVCKHYKLDWFLQGGGAGGHKQSYKISVYFEKIKGTRPMSKGRVEKNKKENI